MKWCAALVAVLLSVIPYVTEASERISAADIPVDPSQVKGTITYYSHFYNFYIDGHMKKWADGFKKIYPNVEGVRVEVLSDYRNQMGALMAAGDYGDVVEIMDNMSRADFEIFYEPLNSLGIQNTHFFPEQYLFDGKYYGFTYGVNAEAVVYNKTLFAKAGIDRFPRTKTDLFAACKKLRAIGVTPFMLNMNAGWPMQQWDKKVLAFAGEGDYFGKMLKDPAPFSKDKPYGRVLSFIRELIGEGCTETNLTATGNVDATLAWQTSLRDMASGRIGMWFLANWSIEQILDIEQIVEGGKTIHSTVTTADLGFAPLPIDDSGEGKVVMDTDFAVAVSAQSTNKATAKAFLYYLLNITDLANSGGFIPGNVNVPATLPQITELRSTKPRFIKLANPPPEFSSAMVAAGFDFMTGTYLRPPVLAKDFDEALRDMNKRWATAIGKD